MRSNTFKVSAAALLPSIATMLVVQACGGSGDAHADGSDADRIEGVWESAVTQRNCDTQAVVATFRGQQAMHRGGTLTDTNSAAPATRGPGMGVWSRNADGTYAARFRFFRYAPDGSLAGTSTVTTTRTLSTDANSYIGVTRAELRDPSGAVVATVCASDQSTRIF